MITLDRNEVERILSYFHLITGFRVSVFDLNHMEIAACPTFLSEFCSELRKNPQADKICRDCDKRAFKKAEEERGLYLYPCDFGLHEAVTPLYDNNKIVGYMMIGQMLSSKSGTKELVMWKSENYWKSLSDRRELLDRMPVLDNKNIKASATLMNICASYLTLTGKVLSKNQTEEQKMLDYVTHHFRENFTDQEICEMFDISRTTYFTAVKKAFGMNKTEYFNKLRVDEAKKLLASTHMTVREIAKDVGYNDQNYFTRIFKRHTGHSPLEYRAHQR